MQTPRVKFTVLGNRILIPKWPVKRASTSKKKKKTPKFEGEWKKFPTSVYKKVNSDFPNMYQSAFDNS